MADNFSKQCVLFAMGGMLYVIIEVLARGYTHWSMLILGGVCFVLIGLINELFSWETPLLLQMLAGAVIITLLEFTTGCVVNLWLGWSVWDYSEEWGNVLGQICPLFSLYWFFLSAVAIFLDDFMRWAFLGEEKPRYKLI